MALVVALVLASAVSAGVAWAHGGEDDPPEGYLFVQQALGHLAHDQGPTGVLDAEAKIQEALGGADQDGVDVDLVRQAQAALTAGQIAVAQRALQESIAIAVGELTPATGEQTGTTVVGEPLPGRGPLSGTSWVLGVVSLLLLVAGVGLALWFRPADNLAQLRRRLTATPPTGTAPTQGRPATSRGDQS